MAHPILGNIVREGVDDDGVATIIYSDCQIQIRIAADEISYTATVEIAESVVRDLINLDAKAKRVAASELTDTYNNGWNEYDETQEDGSLKAVFNPALTEDEFTGKLSLRAINVTGNMLDFFYDDENMFWGHSVVVTSMDDVAFTETHAEIFG